MDICLSRTVSARDFFMSAHEDADNDSGFDSSLHMEDKAMPTASDSEIDATKPVTLGEFKKVALRLLAEESEEDFERGIERALQKKDTDYNFNNVYIGEHSTPQPHSLLCLCSDWLPVPFFFSCPCRRAWGNCTARGARDGPQRCLVGAEGDGYPRQRLREIT